MRFGLRSRTFFSTIALPVHDTEKNSSLRIALICDAYPPSRTSAAVQMRDLASEFRAQGHNPVVLAPLEGLKTAWLYEEHDGVGVMRLRAPAIKHDSYVRRTLAELALPFAMMWGLWRSPY